MTLLGTREIWPRATWARRWSSSPEEFVLFWQDIDEWMEVFYKNNSLGAARTEVHRLSAQGYIASMRMRARIPLRVVNVELAADGWPCSIRA